VPANCDAMRAGTLRRVWSRLRRKQVDGYRFRRQLPVGPYFVDFVCPKARLAIEIDGAGHDDEEHDRRKTAYLELPRINVLRISAANTDEHVDAVVNWIW
jgi:very-short-patch-repair endonuclease